jgi:hypothetical protein
VSIRQLDQENQERFQSAIASLKSSDPDDYKGTAEREYQKELARILQKEGNKAANASTDQRIAGKLKAAGYDLSEIEEVIENHSPMAVKPTQEQRRFYAKSVVQKASFLKNTQGERILGEHRLDHLGMATKIQEVLVSKTEVSEEFNCVFMDAYYSIYEYHGIKIHLPVDNECLESVYIVSKATYQDNGKPLKPPDLEALECFLISESIKEGIEIRIE